MVQARTRTKIVDVLMELAAERPWDEVSLDAIAGRAGVSLAVLRSAFDGRMAILAEFQRRIDERALAALDPDLAGEAPRERLFDILFSRFEALAPYKPAIRNLARAAMRDPLTALELNRATVNSMSWMLNAAGIDATGTRGLVRAQGLALVWGRVLSVWLRDDDPGLARTMAELDRRLREAERTVMRMERLRGLFWRGGRGRPAAGPAGEGNGDAAEGHPS